MILEKATAHDRESLDALLPLVYDELRVMARRQLAGEWRQKPFQTTGLVHEAYLKLIDQSAVPLANRHYFFAAAARAMRQILVDAARRRNRTKRGGGHLPESLNEATLAVDGFAAELIDLDSALDELARTLPRQAQVLECRYFGGLSVEETAGALSISPRSVKRDFALAQAWLSRELRSGPPE
ncbi:MAG: sigma-70 family RNA polymerase sigma factor [Thermoanaerobaculia bacterium]|nr:sigma-70 family RNA polymerase sigma factor [Thermoanaerobaculia bacterium]